jgi:hypothetical protein
LLTHSTCFSTGANPAHIPSIATIRLEQKWLLRHENFLVIVEAKFHQRTVNHPWCCAAILTGSLSKYCAYTCKNSKQVLNSNCTLLGAVLAPIALLDLSALLAHRRKLVPAASCQQLLPQHQRFLPTKHCQQEERPPFRLVKCEDWHGHTAANWTEVG